MLKASAKIQTRKVFYWLRIAQVGKKNLKRFFLKIKILDIRQFRKLAASAIFLSSTKSYRRKGAGGCSELSRASTQI